MSQSPLSGPEKRSKNIRRVVYSVLLLLITLLLWKLPSILTR